MTEDSLKEYDAKDKGLKPSRRRRGGDDGLMVTPQVVSACVQPALKADRPRKLAVIVAERRLTVTGVQ